MNPNYTIYMTHKPLKTILLSLFLLLSTQLLFSQPPGMPGAPDQAPIDGGLTVLVIGGAGLALKKLRSRK
jgi:hypothetical protein